MTAADYISRLNHAEEGDRDLLRQVYRWAESNPALYLDGGGYRDAEDFLDPPGGSVEYVVTASHRPVALLTLIPLAAVPNVYQVGLITNPDASLRKICKLLRSFMGSVFETMAQALFVDLPERPEFLQTRKLARLFGFRQMSKTTFLILKSDYGHAQERKDANHEAERDDRLQRGVQILRHHA